MQITYTLVRAWYEFAHSLRTPGSPNSKEKICALSQIPVLSQIAWKDDPSESAGDSSTREGWTDQVEFKLVLKIGWKCRSRYGLNALLCITSSFHILALTYVPNHAYWLCRLARCTCPGHTPQNLYVNLADMQIHHRCHLHPSLGLLTHQRPPIHYLLPPAQTVQCRLISLTTVHKPCN